MKDNKEMSVFITAEAGANHNRDFELAKELIDVAANAGSDAVKFQTYSSETLYAKNTPDFGGYKNINKLIKDIELPREWQKDLKKYCDDNDIEFMSTPFDEQAVDELYNIGVKRFKIAGFESTDPRFVRCVASTKLPLIITAGIGSNLSSICNIIEWVKLENPYPDLTILHGNNAYPTPFKDINLGTMKDMGSYFLREKRFSNIKIGLSDHTEGILVPPIAVALGARAIEKHYTTDRTLSGPDHLFAIEPGELKQMVENIRIAESILSKKKDRHTESEKRFIGARRSVVAKNDIKRGMPLTEDNLTTKRPLLKDSVPALKYYDIMGRMTSKDIESDEIIKWEMLND